MTLNIKQLHEHMQHRFSDVQQVDESVIRFTRKLADQPFAVYYVDVNPNLPSTREALATYQDRIIGAHYFDGRKSLQWSNYLYFVVGDAEINSSLLRKAKDLIEQDRTYARKFVVSETELDSAIAPPAVQPSSSLPDANILSVWTSKLAIANLEHAILNDESLPARLSMIEAESRTAKPSAKSSITAIPNINAPVLGALQLHKYRAFPTQRKFDFGAVNLIVGANGTGKTSLLEAVELVYCGCNKRNPDSRPTYRIAVTYADGTTENATDSRALRTFRERNLSWYGQSELRTNTLYRSFAQFNFLDTDAAVGLADSTNNLEDDLSKLLVGPESSKTWREIERTRDGVVARLRELQALEQQAKAEQSSLGEQIKEAGGVKQESDAIFTRIQDMIRRVEWSVSDGEVEAFVTKLLESLSEMDSMVQQAVSCDWVDSPVSLDSLRKYSDEVNACCDTREIFGQTVESFLDSSDAGKDGAFAGTWVSAQGEALSGRFVIQCKFTSKRDRNLSQSDLAEDAEKAKRLVQNGRCCLNSGFKWKFSG